MFKANKLLKVISILLIIFGILGVIGSALLLALPGMSSASAAAGVTVSTGQTIFSIILTLVEIAIGIIGLSAKKEKLVLIAAITYFAIQVISLVTAIITTGFNALALIGFVFPILYFWGYYQSK